MKGIMLLLVALTFGCTSSKISHGIPNLALVEPGVWRGGQPNEEGWEWLREQGVLVDLKLDTWNEGDSDFDGGPFIFYAPISFWRQTFRKPEQRWLDGDVITIMHAHRDGICVFVHCLHGQDRTGLIIGSYRVSEGWSKDAAYKEMRQHGFHPELLGLYRAWLNVPAGVERGRNAPAGTFIRVP